MPSATTAYKLLLPAEYAHFRSSPPFAGSPLDRQDGYIHLSTAAQALPTFQKYYADQEDVVLVEVDLTKLGQGSEVRWELAPKRGEEFPHVYGRGIPWEAVGRVWEGVGEEVLRGLEGGK